MVQEQGAAGGGGGKKRNRNRNKNKNKNNKDNTPPPAQDDASPPPTADETPAPAPAPAPQQPKASPPPEKQQQEAPSKPVTNGGLSAEAELVKNLSKDFLPPPDWLEMREAEKAYYERQAASQQVYTLATSSFHSIPSIVELCRVVFPIQSLFFREQNFPHIK